jgi:RND family efflux transporter MFP subunit
MKNRISLTGIAAVCAAGALMTGTGHALAAGPIGCLIEPERVAELGSPAIGVIKTMLVERGDRVQKGQVIAVLKDDVERASLDVAHSRSQADAEVRGALAGAELAQQRRERAKDLHAKGFIAAQALEQTLAETKVAEEKLLQAREQKQSLEKELALARVRLSERTIRSPFDGVIVERYFSAGERVEEKPMVRVARVDPLRVEVVMPSSMYGSVKVGSTARVTPDLPGVAPMTATVSLVDKVLDPASGTYRVRMLLPNANARIPAGLRCRVDFAAAPAVQPTSAGPTRGVRKAEAENALAPHDSTGSGPMAARKM